MQPGSQPFAELEAALACLNRRTDDVPVVQLRDRCRVPRRGHRAAGLQRRRGSCSSSTSSRSCSPWLIPMKQSASSRRSSYAVGGSSTAHARARDHARPFLRPAARRSSPRSVVRRERRQRRAIGSGGARSRGDAARPPGRRGRRFSPVAPAHRRRRRPAERAPAVPVRADGTLRRASRVHARPRDLRTHRRGAQGSRGDAPNPSTRTSTATNRRQCASCSYGSRPSRARRSVAAGSLRPNSRRSTSTSSRCRPRSTRSRATACSRWTGIRRPVHRRSRSRTKPCSPNGIESATGSTKAERTWRTTRAS